MSMRRRTYRSVSVVVAVALLVLCGSSHQQLSGQAQTKQYPTSPLDQMLAPIALYPDSLLAQILMSAGDPPKVTELNKWMMSNQKLKGTQLQDEAVKAGFDASFVALVLFPQVVTTMAEQIAWTTKLGQAFASDKSAVFDSIQKLRKQAKDVGTLKTTQQQEVETKKTSAGQDVIVIEPANPQVVYVPQYNYTTVYTQPPTTTTVVVQQDNDADVAVAAGLIGFTAGIAIGAAMDNNYYYGPYGMRGGAYMYNDAWDDYADHREDAREDYMDHREDLMEERTDRAENRTEQRTERTESTQEQRTERQENRPETDAQRSERTAQAQSGAAQRDTAPTQGRTGSTEARGYGDSSRAETSQRSGSSRSSDAFSGYSSGASERSASTRGQQSRSSASRSRGGGGGGSRRR